MSRLSRREFSKNERGFTLPEVLMVIGLMGKVFAIVSSAWFGNVYERLVRWLGARPAGRSEGRLTLRELKFQDLVADNIPSKVELLIAAGGHKGDRDG